MTIHAHSAELRLKPIFHHPGLDGDRRAALAALAAHLPVLTDPGLVFGTSTPAEPNAEGVIVMGHFSLGPEAVAFMDDIYAYGWVRDFDWMGWSHTPEGQRMLHDPSALENADEDDLAQVLTVCMREAHWGPEALHTRFREGLLPRLMERAATLSRSRN
ncbi:hypothetical protein B2G69_18140 [Methylorubrum zatmanii]|nr:DUF6508 domain-containing protein [Methylorubrum zatmanii]ARO55865.1 hypothetical protein B2G69_18140 [Methylorubrum zatmanii]